MYATLYYLDEEGYKTTYVQGPFAAVMNHDEVKNAAELDAPRCDPSVGTLDTISVTSETPRRIDWPAPPQYAA